MPEAEAYLRIAPTPFDAHHIQITHELIDVCHRIGEVSFSEIVSAYAWVVSKARIEECVINFRNLNIDVGHGHLWL